ncbi:carbohydrate-binding domain-containing protein, partial [Turicibacter sanguinis]|nr:carbohydrate-binding domain-containing protein [Turicibacter sanguinis]
MKLNNKHKGTLFLAFLATMGLSACQSNSNNDTITNTQATDETSSSQSLSTQSTVSANATIQLKQDQTTVEGNGVSIDGNTITITSGGTYNISGTLTDGQIIVDSSDELDVELVLNGVEITSSSSAPIYVKNAKNAIINLVEGTENIVTDSDSYVLEDPTNNEPNAAIFSKDDLKIKGTGSLVVNANYDHGIVSKDDLKIKNGNITVTSVGDGLKGKDSIEIEDGTLTINAGGDGLQSSNAEDPTRGYITIDGGTLNIVAGLDGIQAETNVTINGGSFDIQSGGGSTNSSSSTNTNMIWGQWGAPASQTTTETSSSSAKGIKAVVDITINGGTFTIDSSD